MNIGESDLLQHNPSLVFDTKPSQAVHSIENASSDMSEALRSLVGGLSGLMFTLSLIFFLQAPMISGSVLLALASGWGGSALYQSRRESVQKQNRDDPDQH